MIHFRVRYERLAGLLARRRWRVAVWRGAWLALLVPLAGLALAMMGATPRWWVVWWVAAAVFAAATWYFGRTVSLGDLGRRLDRRFRLAELLVTAVEVDRRGPRSSVETRLLDDAAMAVARLSQGGTVADAAVRREVEMTVAVGLMLAGLWLLSGALTPIPPPLRLAALSLPAPGGGSGMDVAAGPGGRGPGPGPGPGPGSAPILEGVAEALGDQAVTLGVAAALRAADPAQAAREVRALADRAAALSPTGRADLAAAMAQAAAAASDTALAETLAAVSAALRQTEPVRLSESLARLATALDARSVAPGAGRVARAATPAARVGLPAERLRGDAKPLPLAQEPGGAPAGQGQAAGLASVTGADSEAAGAAAWGLAADPGDAPAGGWDPQAVPSTLRPMVRRYFARGGAEP